MGTNVPWDRLLPMVCACLGGVGHVPRPFSIIWSEELVDSFPRNLYLLL